MPTRPDSWDILVGGAFYEPLESYVPDKASYGGIARSLVPDDWRTNHKGVWFYCTPPDSRIPPQVWKIHLSATTHTAEEVLRLAAPILVEANVDFKCAVDRRMLSLLNGKGSSRGGSGKFITIYPYDRDMFLSLAQHLSNATAHLAGPYILSDRRFGESRVVYYRYGGFWQRTRLDVTGAQIPVIAAPDGSHFDDRREAFFVLPPWEKDPGPPAPPADGDPRTLKSGRYYVEKALSFSNAGGVYVATDRETNKEVIIKEARPLVNWVSKHDDAISLLKKEHRLLTKLSSFRISPQPYDLFQDWEHWFLVQEYVSGTALWDLGAIEAVLLRPEPSEEQLRDAYRRFRDIFLNVSDAVRIMHEQGIVFCDLSPRNILVDDQTSEIRIIDFEAACEVGVDQPTLLSTPGFTSPRSRIDGSELAVTPEHDHYALAALMLSYVFRVTVFTQFQPSTVSRVVNTIMPDARIPESVRELVICGLEDRTASDYPQALHRALEVSEDLAPAPAPSVPSETALREVLDGTVSFTVNSANAEHNERLFPLDFRSFRTNGISLAYGVGGVLHVLNALGTSLDAQWLSWFCERAEKSLQTPQPPGWAIGQAGVAWVLLDLGFADLAKQLFQAAVSNPILSQSHDLFSGLAGVGQTALHFYHCTGDDAYLAHAKDLASRLRASAISDDDGRMFWKRAGFPVDVGLHHGASGVALFLLYASLVLEDDALLDVGLRAMRYDVQFGMTNAVAGRLWPYNAEDMRIGSPYWRHGSAGVGTAALRYKFLGGLDEFDEVLEDIAEATNTKYTVLPSNFLGLSGIGNFHLDWYQFSGDGRHRTAALKAAAGITLYRIDTPTGVTFPSGEQDKISCDYGAGIAGIAAFINRILRGGFTEFLLDEPLFMTQRTGLSGAAGHRLVATRD